MKRFSLIFIGYILISNICFSQLILKIDIPELKNNRGEIMLQLFDENKKIVKQEISLICNNMCSFVITNLKAGKYAVRYYHDENQNGKLETNLAGKPLEGYGFSNNVIGKLGAPPFEKWLFEIKRDTNIILKPHY